MNDPLEMSDLPELVLIKLFNCLPLHDQLLSVRLVCKKWKLLVEQNNLANCRSELVLLRRMERRPLIWSHNQQPVDLRNSLILNTLTNSSTLLKRFASVKKLYIAMFENFGGNETPICHIVHHFLNLEHLEINNMCIERGGPDAISKFIVDFNLPKLKTLYLGNNDRLVNLNCPTLTRLSLFDAFHWNETLSRTLNHLQFLKVRSFSHEPGLGMANLEELYLIDDLQIDLPLFPKLREVHFYQRNMERDIPRENDQDDPDDLMPGPPVPPQEAALLFERKVRLGRNLKVYCSGFPCDTLQELNEGISKLRDTLIILGSPTRFKCPRTELLGGPELDWIAKGHLDRIKLENVKRSLFLFSGSQFEELSKWSSQAIEYVARSLEHSGNILSVQESLLRNSEHFETVGTLDSFLDAFQVHDPSFLKLRALYRYVIQLHLIGPLCQSSVNKLPDLMPNLIAFESSHDPDWTTINFSFLSRFRGLKSLIIMKEFLSLDLLEMLLAQCRFLSYLGLIGQGDQISVRPVGEKGYKIWIQASSDVQIVSSKLELLDFLRRNQLLKRHFFDDYFSKSYYLESHFFHDYFKSYYIDRSNQLEPISYFIAQEH